MGENAGEKAHRLHQEGRVRLVSDDGQERRYEVQGDSSLYLVRWTKEAWICGCPAMSEYGRDRCSHVLAALLAWSASHADGNVVNHDGKE